MKKYLSILFLLLASYDIAISQVGNSCEEPVILFPATNCSNTDGVQFLGRMQCPTADCSSYFSMNASLPYQDLACTEDDERNQSVVWMKVRATSNSFTINNGKAYIGSGSAAANTKDYTVFSGTCFNMKQLACHTLTANTSAVIEGLQPGKDYFIIASPSVAQTKSEAISTCITSTVAYEAPGNNCSEAVEISINNSYDLNNAGATPDGPLSASSIENNTWYKWSTPSDWIPGQSAYIRVYNPTCNSTEGLQIMLWNAGNACPEKFDKPTIVSRAPETNDEYYHQWTPVANKSYYISIDGYAGLACQFKLEIRSISVMPVNLITLDARSIGKNVSLSWITLDETNNSFFTVEKSRNGKDFIPLSKINGAGKSTTERTYQIEDEYPFSDINYYRLKQSDEKGNYTYSKTIAIIVQGEGNFFHAKANSRASNIDIAYFSTDIESGTLRIYDRAGYQLYNMNLQFVQGRNNYKIDSQLFPLGAYTVKLETPSAKLSGNVLLEKE